MSETKIFRQLIESAEKEQEIQSYLEEHPHLLIGMLISPNATIVSQFPLGSDFRADFAFVHSNSGGNYIDLLELKRPKEKIFNKDASFTQPFNSALQQIQDDVAWVRNNNAFVMRQIKPLVRYLKSDNLYVNGLMVLSFELNRPIYSN